MTRMTDEDIADMLRTATHDERTALLELKERRALDREIARQSDVVREYHKRWTAYPSDATADLLTILDRLVNWRVG